MKTVKKEKEKEKRKQRLSLNHTPIPEQKDQLKNTQTNKRKVQHETHVMQIQEKKRKQ